MTESVFKWARLGLAATGAVATTVVPALVSKKVLKLAIVKAGFKFASGAFTPWLQVAMTGWTVYEARGPIKEGLERGWDWYRQQRGQTRQLEDGDDEKVDDDEKMQPTTEVMLISKL
uniref:Putative conserved secreted protein n=1 Tax=Culex tarsalis TaxID=7177 RepID=A0A1Q3FSJ3_CULTA